MFRLYLSNIIILIILGNRSWVNGIQTVNILHIHDNNSIAIDAIAEVERYCNRNEEQFNVRVQLKNIAASNDEQFLINVCQIQSQLITDNDQLHIILDTTKSSFNLQLVRLFLQRMTYLSANVISSVFSFDFEIEQKDKEQFEKIIKLNCKCIESVSDHPNHYAIVEPIQSIRYSIPAIVNYFNMTNLNTAIFCDDTFYKSDDLQIFLKSQAKSKTKSFFNKTDILRLIRTYRKYDVVNFIVMAKSDTIKFVLHTIPDEYFRENFQWILICPDSGQILQAYKNVHATVLLLRPIPINENIERFKDIQSSSEHLSNINELLTGFYFDLALKSVLIVRNDLQSNEFRNNTECLSDVGQNYRNKSNRYLDFSSISEQSIYGTFRLSDLQDSIPFHYEFDLNVTAISVANNFSDIYLGTWTSTNHRNTTIAITNLEAIRQIKTKPIYRIYTVLHAPFIMQDSKNPKKITGFCIDLIDEIAARMNFNYDIFLLNSSGKLHPNGRWDGVMEKLISRDADIGLGTISVMSDRDTVIDFSVPFYDLTGISIMTKFIVPTENLFSFLTVLEKDAWLLIFIAYLSTSILLSVFDRWSPYSFRNTRNRNVEQHTRIFSLKECLWFCLTTLTPQGGGDIPRSSSAKLVTATWWFFGFIIMSSYTANLAAFFTVKQLDKPIESLDDLTEQYKMLYAPLNDSFELAYFQRMANIEKRFYAHWKDISLNDSLTAFERSELAVWNYPVNNKYAQILQVFETAGLPNSLEQAVERVRNSTTKTGFAFIGDATSIRYLTMTNCDLQMIGEEFSRRPYAIALQQGSALKEQIDAIILELLSTRFMDGLKKKWWNYEENAAKCEEFQRSHFDGISIHNIGGIFLTIIFGISVACLSLVFEYLWYRKKNALNALERNGNLDGSMIRSDPIRFARRHSHA